MKIKSILVFLLMFSLFILEGCRTNTSQDESVKGDIIKNEIIMAGSLDVELYYSKDSENWAPVNLGTYIFNKDAKWEPGYTEIVLLKVVNAGTSGLKYHLSLDIIEEHDLINVYGDKIKVSDYLKVGAKVTDTEDLTVLFSKDTAKAVAVNNEIGFGEGFSGASLLPGEYCYIQLVIYMPEESADEIKYDVVNAPTITFGLDLIATQFSNEEDSFDDQYDKDVEAEAVLQELS